MDLDELLPLPMHVSATPSLPVLMGGRKTKRSASEPAYHLRYSDHNGFGMESKFLNSGDSVSLYSENDGGHGFVSTLG